MKSLGAVVCAKILRTEGCAPTTPFGELIYFAQKKYLHTTTHRLFISISSHFFPAVFWVGLTYSVRRWGSGVCRKCVSYACVHFSPKPTEAHRRPSKMHPDGSSRQLPVARAAAAADTHRAAPRRVVQTLKCSEPPRVIAVRPIRWLHGAHQLVHTTVARRHGVAPPAPRRGGAGCAVAAQTL